MVAGKFNSPEAVEDNAIIAGKMATAAENPANSEYLKNNLTEYTISFFSSLFSLTMTKIVKYRREKIHTIMAI